MSVRDAFRAAGQRLKWNPLDLASFFFSVVSFATVPATSFFQGDWKSALGLTVYCGLAVVYLVMLLRVVRPPAIETMWFVGVRDLSPETRWPRDEAFNEVRARLEDEQRPIVFVSGRSGSGKTVLFEARVIPAFEKKGTVICVSDYMTLQEDVWRAVGGEARFEQRFVLNFPDQPDLWLPDGERILFVFDQLERLVGAPAENVLWLNRFLTAAKQLQRVHIAAIVRQEFFYQLRILGEHVPAPGDVYEMPEIDFDAQSGDAVVVARRLKQIAGAAVARSVTAGTLAHEARGQSDQLHGRILPLEMQVAGEALERLFRKSHEYEVDERQYRRIGGTRDSLIREYFDYYIGQSSDRELAPSVLYALTVAPPPHHLTIEEIARAAYALPERVEAVLRDFTAAGLLRTTESGYQWTHESLAAMYADTAPSDLLAAAREAVRYHVQHRTTGFDARTSHAPALIALSHAVVALMVSSILGWGLLNAERAFVPGTYLFAIPAHVGWAFFVYRFALAFVVRLRRGAVVAWLFVALMGAASLVVTMKWPETWIGSMGLTGAAIGLTLLFATAWPRRAPLIRRPVRAEGWKFIIVGFLMIVAGIGYAALARDGAYPVPLTYAGAGLTIALAVLAASATHRHATAAAGAVWLSYVERP